MNSVAVIAEFTPAAWQTLAVIVCLFGMLVFTTVPPDMAFTGGLAVLLLLGVLDADSAFAGFGSPGLVTVGALYVVVAGLQETGGLNWLSRSLLGTPKSAAGARARMMGPVGALSAFLNNTPVVALFIPMVMDWCHRHRLAPSRYLIPLSYASILGGMCTLIGTSTNLVVNGLYITRYGGEGLSMFEITLLGLPCAVLGLVYVALLGDRLLPAREEADRALENFGKYTLELVVDTQSPLAGKAVGKTDLVEAPGGYLVELVRGERVISPVSPEEGLEEGDRLVYAGNLDTLKSLFKVRGVHPASEEAFDRAPAPGERRLVEAVVSDTCPMVGKTLREGRFRQQYNAVVIAMARNGERLRGSLRDIPLKTGDVLLVESHAGFIPRQRDSGDFYLLHALDEEVIPGAPARAVVSFAILVGMVLVVALGVLSMLKASLLAAGFMLLTKCCTAGRARRRIEWNVLLVIGGALGVGTALETSGGARVIADGVTSLSGGSPWLALALIYLNTVLFTEMVTNNAAVALVFPVAMNTAERLGASPMPFLLCLMIAGSASFATPIGYQTNLMVYGAGRYRFADYLRIGIPLSVLVGIVAVGLAPLIYPF